MSFITSALVLAWLAIVVLAMGFAGLLRQVMVLSRRQTGPATSSRTASDLIGFTVPASGELAALRHPQARATVVAFVSPGCPSCAQTLQALAAMPEAGSASLALTAVSTGSCAPAADVLGDGPTCIAQGRPVLERLQVPATPYLMVLDRAGTITAAMLPDEHTDVPAWVRRSAGFTGSPTLSEESR